MALIQSSGLLKSARFLSCGHWYADDFDPEEKVVIKFAEFGSPSAHLDLVFKSDGTIGLWAIPNKQSTWRMECILTAAQQSPSGDIEKIIEDSLDIISKTLELYSTSVPSTNYGPLLHAWQNLNPKLFDRG